VRGRFLLSIQIKIPEYDLPVRRVKPRYIDVDRLLPHEEIVTERLHTMKKFIEKTGVIDLPIIIASIPGTHKYLIVDGHHRWAALRDLGARKVPSIIVDYFSDSVKVFTWYLGVGRDYSEVLRRMKNSGLEISKCFFRPEVIGDRMIEKIGDKAFIIISNRGVCLEVHGFIEGQRTVFKLLDRLNAEGFIDLVWYGLLRDALRGLKSGEVDLLFLRRPLRKEEIIRVVMKGEVLPPKTTRHILPYIPAKINIPLESLL